MIIEQVISIVLHYIDPISRKSLFSKTCLTKVKGKLSLISFRKCALFVKVPIGFTTTNYFIYKYSNNKTDFTPIPQNNCK